MPPCLIRIGNGNVYGTAARQPYGKQLLSIKGSEGNDAPIGYSVILSHRDELHKALIGKLRLRALCALIDLQYLKQL